MNKRTPRLKSFCRVKLSSNDPAIINDLKNKIESAYPSATLYRATATYLFTKNTKELHLYLAINGGTQQ